MRRAAYVFSVLGESPAVLSELLWWLCVKERAPIAGIEVWATGRGAERLRDLVASPAWAELERQTGPLPVLQPPGSEPDASHGFRVHVFQVDGVALDDVRSESESASVAARLHDRVRGLRSALAEHIDLVGSLAGGRKTVSASLQTAFCLQAGPRDRLVHVLLHPALEAELRQQGVLASFCAPSGEWVEPSSVPVDEQVLVYDVPFPRIRHLVPRRLADVLETMDWDEVWPALDANMGMDALARLTRTARERWTFEVVDSLTERVLYEKRLKARLGAMLAAMASASQESTAQDLIAWLDGHEVGWRPSASRGNSPQTRQSMLRSAASALRSELSDIPIGLERLGPPSQGFAMPHVEVVMG